MPQASLQLVFRATALAKLRYASPARWDFANAAKRNRLKAFSDELANEVIIDLPVILYPLWLPSEQADQQLYRSIKHTRRGQWHTHSPLRRLLTLEQVHHITPVPVYIITNRTSIKNYQH